MADTVEPAVSPCRWGVLVECRLYCPLSLQSWRDGNVWMAAWSLSSNNRLALKEIDVQ